MTSTLRKQIGWNNTVDLFCLICKGGITEINNKCDLLLPGWEKQAQRHPEEKDSSWWTRVFPTAWLGPPSAATLTGRGSLGGLSEEWVTWCQEWVTSCSRSGGTVPRHGHPCDLLLSYAAHQAGKLCLLMMLSTLSKPSGEIELSTSSPVPGYSCKWVREKTSLEIWWILRDFSPSFPLKVIFIFRCRQAWV